MLLVIVFVVAALNNKYYFLLVQVINITTLIWQNVLFCSVINLSYLLYLSCIFCNDVKLKTACFFVIIEVCFLLHLLSYSDASYISRSIQFNISPVFPYHFYLEHPICLSPISTCCINLYFYFLFLFLISGASRSPTFVCLTCFQSTLVGDVHWWIERKCYKLFCENQT